MANSNKYRVMNDLLRTMNKNISEERGLLDSMRHTSEALSDLYKELDKRNQRSSSVGSQDISRNLESLFEDVTSINDTLSDIKDILSGDSTRRRHDSANPLSDIHLGQGRNRNSDGSPNTSLNKYVELAGRIFSAIGLQQLLSRLGQSIDKSIVATYNLQQITGLGEYGSYGYKGYVNSLFKGSSVYNANEEWDRIASVAKTTGMDDMERLTLKYTKAIAVGVESMALDTADLSNILYTIEKRGTFTSAQLENVIDYMYKYSSSSGEVTPEELQKVIAESLDGLMYGIDMSEEDYLRELEETTAVSTSILDRGFSAEFVSQISNILNDIMLKGVNSDYYSQLSTLPGVNGELVRQLLESSGDYSSAMEVVFQGLEDVANSYGKTATNYDAQLITGLGFGYDNQTRALLMGKEGLSTEELKASADSSKSAEEAAEDMSRSVLDEFGNRVENFFAPVVDWFAEKGIGGSELGVAGGILGGIFGKKIFNGAKGGLSRLFGGGATDDVVNAAANSMDDAARAAASSLDDAGRVVLGSTDEVLEGAGRAASGLSKAGKALGAVGIAIEGVTTAVDATKAYKEGDNREGTSEIGEGIGAIGGGWGGAAAGAAIGTAIAPGIGTIIGGIIGGVAGGLGGGAAGRVAGGAIYDATHDYNEFSSEQALQIKSYYSEVSKLYSEYGNDAAQAYTISEVIPYLRSIGVSASITDRYLKDVGKPDFLKDYENDKFIGYYAQGTPFLPSDGLIFAHEGEAIIPAQYNPVNNVSSMRNISNSLVDKDDINDIYDILDEIKKTLSEFSAEFSNNIKQEQLKDKLNSSKLAVTNTRKFQYTL